MTDLIKKLAESIEKSGCKISFGLEQQGHIPTIERILSELPSNDCTWKKIGKEIGWCPVTARDYYITFLRRQIQK